MREGVRLVWRSAAAAAVFGAILAIPTGVLAWGLADGRSGGLAADLRQFVADAGFVYSGVLKHPGAAAIVAGTALVAAGLGSLVGLVTAALGADRLRSRAVAAAVAGVGSIAAVGYLSFAVLAVSAL